MRKPVNIYLLGLGINGTIHVTEETKQAARSCSTLFVLHDDPNVVSYLWTLCEDVRDVVTYYSVGQARADVYSRIADAVVERSEAEDVVGLAVHGHPLFLVSAAENVIRRGRDKGLRVRILPAVSSFDTLLCDLEVDYGYGLQMFDATTMLLRGWRPNPYIPLLVFQLATVLDSAVVNREPSPRSLEPLAARLRQFYPPDHECVIVRSAATPLEGPQKAIVRLDELDLKLSVPLWERPTLYVPELTS